jgi:hypothetical protein
MMLNTSAVALLAAAGSILVSAYFLVTPQVPDRFGSRSTQVQSAIDRMPIDEDALRKVAALDGELARLGQPLVAEDSAIDIALLGYREIKPPPPTPVFLPEPAPVVEAPLPEVQPFDYTISMTYVSDDHRYAVIDGHFYREGAVLRGGERLLAIAPNAVQIQRHDMTNWVEIRRPAQSLSDQDIIEADQSGLSSDTGAGSVFSPSRQVQQDG